MTGFRVDPTIADMSTLLSQYHHWTIKTVNRKNRRVGYSCTIWHGGRRVEGQRQDVAAAVMVAVNKLKDLAAGTDAVRHSLSVFNGDSSDDEDCEDPSGSDHSAEAIRPDRGA